MAKQTICTEPNCGGTIINDICKKCKAIYDENPEAQAFIASEGGSVTASVTPALSSLSRRSKVADEPTSLSSVAPVPRGMRKADEGVSLQALQATLGGGVVKMPTILPVDRMAQIDATLRTPLSKRICSTITCVDTTAKPDKNGKQPRSRLYFPAPAKLTKLPPNCRLEEQTDDETGITTKYLVPDVGFCRKCTIPFNFLPFARGQMIDQIRIDGPFAYGGDGFLYHATDTELGVPVVIKAPHGDKSSIEVATGEREALVAMQGEPSVVQILGFKKHEDQQLIVMERLNGPTLFDVRVQNGGPLPIEVGLSYFMGAVQAVRAGHEKAPARLFMDIKPQNFMVIAPGDRLKAIDFGGSYVVGRKKQEVVYTEGFSAPELDPESTLKGVLPSKESDTFGLFRMLCFLSMNFSLTGRYRFTLPTPSEEPLFSEIESLYRFGRRCVATNPDERMTLAEAYDQAALLRAEIVALKERRTIPTVSTIFAGDTTKEVESSHRTLPQLRIDSKDPAAALVDAAVSIPDPRRQRALLENAIVEFPDSREAKLRLASLAIDTDDFAFAARALEQLLTKDPFDCRTVYHLGRLALAKGDAALATNYFDACYSCWPAEVGVKIALGHAAELTGDNAAASRYYETASWVNPDYVAGPFGWARCAEKEGDLSTAIEAYDRVSMSSWAFRKAVTGKVRALIQIISSASKGSIGVGLAELQNAADAATFVVQNGELDGLRLKADILRAALGALRARTLKADSTISLLGVPLVERHLRDAASQALVSCGRLTPDRSERTALVDEAHRVGRFKIF